jgi:hypothetical protein
VTPILEKETMTRQFASIYRDSILTQLYLDVITSSLLPGFAKIAPWWLARRDNFSVNYQHWFPGGLAPPPLSAHTSGPLTIIRLKFNTFGFPHCK